jgi:hypothetical protein
VADGVSGHFSASQRLHVNFLSWAAAFEPIASAAVAPPETFTFGGVFADVIAFNAHRRMLAIHAPQRLAAKVEGCGIPSSTGTSRYPVRPASSSDYAQLHSRQARLFHTWPIGGSYLLFEAVNCCCDGFSRQVQTKSKDGVRAQAFDGIEDRPCSLRRSDPCSQCRLQNLNELGDRLQIRPDTWVTLPQTRLDYPCFRPSPQAQERIAELRLQVLSRGCCLTCMSAQSSKLWECGNRKAISKGGGKDGKPAFGFPGFPPPGISTALLLSVAAIS